jgi:pyruvate carboxylase
VYADVNQLLGDIVKVTPTSKAVGDMALFLVANDLTCDDVLDAARDSRFPSRSSIWSAAHGPAAGRIPPKVRDRILRGEKPLEGRPGRASCRRPTSSGRREGRKLLSREPTRQRGAVVPAVPQGLRDFAAHQQKYTDTSSCRRRSSSSAWSRAKRSRRTRAGQDADHQVPDVGDPHDDGTRTVFFELNGQPRHVTVVDQSLVREGHAQQEGRSRRRPAGRRQHAGHGGRPWPSAPATKWPKARSC